MERRIKQIDLNSDIGILINMQHDFIKGFRLQSSKTVSHQSRSPLFEINSIYNDEIEVISAINNPKAVSQIDEVDLTNYNADNPQNSESKAS